MNRKEGMLFFLAGAVMFSGCSHAQTAKGSAETSVEKSSTDAAAEVDTTNMFSDRDKEIGYEESESVAIRLADDNSSCTSDAVSITENTVTITDEGTYVLSGTLTEGMVLVCSIWSISSGNMASKATKTGRSAAGSARRNPPTTLI